MSDERTPLLQDSDEAREQNEGLIGDRHSQFCHLIGTRPLTLPLYSKHKPHPESLYHRATTQRTKQHITYMFTATLTNTLIMSQIVLGAALTGLGASNASGVLITIFGAMNTIIAGAIAFLKSRGQPMRARMFRDDLERVVDEIENSAIMWLGISKNVHGYDAIDTDEQVTVRSEVARLTRLFDRAVKTNTLNDPDNYQFGGPSDLHAAALRDKTGVGAAPPPPAPAPTASPPDPAPASVAPQDVDASPATNPPETTKPTDAAAPTDDAPKPADTAASPDKGKQPADTPTQAAPSQSSSSATPDPAPQPTPAPPSAPPPPPPADPDESPASAAHPMKHTQDTSNSDDATK